MMKDPGDMTAEELRLFERAMERADAIHEEAKRQRGWRDEPSEDTAGRIDFLIG